VRKKSQKPSKQYIKAAASVRKGRKLTQSDVVALTKRFPPRLKYGADTLKIKKSSLAVHYSIDTLLQTRSKKLLRKYQPRYGAAVALHPSSGRTFALAAYTHPDRPPIAADLYCRSIFPAASIIKIIAAAAAIEKAGLTSRSALKTSGKNHTLYNFQLARELKTFREVSLDEAFAYSINPVFGRIGIYLLGRNGLQQYITAFGFNADVPFDLHTEAAQAHAGDSLFSLAETACGFNQRTVISPLFGALIAAAVSNDGVMPAPTLIDSIVDIQKQSTLYKANARPWRMPVRPQTAAELRTLMHSVARFGTARTSFRYVKRSGRFGNIQYGGKTGNVDMDGIGRVDWFVGFARHATDRRQHIAVCAVTVHGPYWTVHSSFIGAEIIRAYIRSIQIADTYAQQ
jgi:cell division protein FtsI/penicillin-binding protein 2